LGIGDWGLGIGPNPQSPIPISIFSFFIYITNIISNILKIIINNINKEQNNNKNNFESFVVELRDTREDVMNIVKIIIEQNKIDPFIKFIKNKNVDNNENERIHKIKIL
jgi:hypothetical protein